MSRTAFSKQQSDSQQNVIIGLSFVIASYPEWFKLCQYGTRISWIKIDPFVVSSAISSKGMIEIAAGDKIQTVQLVRVIAFSDGLWQA